MSSKPVVNPSAMEAETAAKMLTLPAEIIRKHIKMGAPVNKDGTVNLVHYAAWLNKRLSDGN